MGGIGGVGTGIQETYLRAGHPSGDAVSSDGYIHSEIFLHDIQEMLLRKEGPPSRKVLPSGMG